MEQPTPAVVKKLQTLASVRPKNAPVAVFRRGDERQIEAEDDPRGEKAGGFGKRQGRGKT